MLCIYCHGETSVINSRYKKRQNNVWRRRRCETCRHIFTTNEIIDYERAWTVINPAIPKIKRPFQREKLFISMHNSLQHHPDPVNDAVGITDTVITKLTWAGITQDSKAGQTDVALTTTAIATAAFDALKRFDKAAATMYHAYHADVL